MTSYIVCLSCLVHSWLRLTLHMAWISEFTSIHATITVLNWYEAVNLGGLYGGVALAIVGAEGDAIDYVCLRREFMGFSLL